MTQDENEKLLQDPLVAALLKAIDGAAFGGQVWGDIMKARAAFAPPVEMEYTMPSWDAVVGIGEHWINEGTYNKAREATKRPKQPAEKLGREWCCVLNVYGKPYLVFEHLENAKAYLGGNRHEIRRVREVLE